MDQNEIMRVSIENVRNIINNSILLLRDADHLLLKEGFLPKHSTIGSESSISLSQSPDQAKTFFPQYMSRYYTYKESDKLLCLNIQFYHFKQEILNPCLIAAICTLKKNDLQYWWIKYFAFETDIEFKSDGSIFTYEDEKANVKFWGKELFWFNSYDYLKEEISKMVSEYHL